MARFYSGLFGGLVFGVAGFALFSALVAPETSRMFTPKSEQVAEFNSPDETLPKADLPQGQPAGSNPMVNQTNPIPTGTEFTRGSDASPVVPADQTGHGLVVQDLIGAVIGIPSVETFQPSEPDIPPIAPDAKLTVPMPHQPPEDEVLPTGLPPKSPDRQPRLIDVPDLHLSAPIAERTPIEAQIGNAESSNRPRSAFDLTSSTETGEDPETISAHDGADRAADLDSDKPAPDDMGAIGNGQQDVENPADRQESHQADRPDQGHDATIGTPILVDAKIARDYVVRAMAAPQATDENESTAVETVANDEKDQTGRPAMPGQDAESDHRTDHGIITRHAPQDAPIAEGRHGVDTVDGPDHGSSETTTLPTAVVLENTATDGRESKEHFPSPDLDIPPDLPAIFSSEDYD